MSSSHSLDRVQYFMATHTDFLSHSATSVPPNTECPICLEGIEEHICVQIVGIPGCTHLIGMECLQAMLSSYPNAKKICPLCRTEWLGDARGRGRGGRGAHEGEYDEDDGREAYDDFAQDARYHDAARDAYYSVDYQGEMERVRRQQEEQMEQYRQGQAARHGRLSRDHMGSGRGIAGGHGPSPRDHRAGHMSSGRDSAGGHGPSRTQGAGHMGTGRGRDARADRDLAYLNGESLRRGHGGSSRSHAPPLPVNGHSSRQGHLFGSPSPFGSSRSYAPPSPEYGQSSSHRHGHPSHFHAPPPPVYRQSFRNYSPPPHSSHRGIPARESSLSVSQRLAHNNPDLSEADWQRTVDRIQGTSSFRPHGESSHSHRRQSSPVYGGSYSPPSRSHGYDSHHHGGSSNALPRYDAHDSDSDDSAYGTGGDYYSYDAHDSDSDDSAYGTGGDYYSY
ncbi:hypothetical protein BDU57DRAFT_527011 [Ampelomyces quisqualis]|uniref:RING-type domain-containing protein n=1 Tax=Ampelomyces quisqualis TaxID=50730 RepID=A0A6A5QWA0_AMPQU|nr:hypothetical protein BDU57DRAFT_527011 [Ampelomyces quisqualis]